MEARQFVLSSRPSGAPTRDNFALQRVELPELAEGQVLVRNEVLSVDPYMRPRMDDRPSYVPPYRLDAPLDGGAVGTVVASRSPDRPVGTAVRHMRGWRDLAILDAAATDPLPETSLPLSYHLGILGMPGLTAYAGLQEVASLREGDTLFVSGAAGAVGGLVGQFARLMGATRVVGSAGSDEKARLVEDLLGFDACFNYRSGPVRELLSAVAPGGLDVYFDNVGGEHLAAAIEAMRLNGRIAMCGIIADYDTAPQQRALQADLFQVIGRRITIRGFISTDHASLRPEFLDTVTRWVEEGRIHYRETVTEGLDKTPDAFIEMLRGGNIGKAIVRI
ncbi:NADP-dependent oxidoreductase [Aeromicrobium phragmitis]|uniref:NADP-dependent oxidoreductase n=1 Tax=Aeromicrobium phragmitis TaxID=2478914 RepID=A0A3L8PJB8_9ACTN|nr:NADP-dependent oxidoreductase [Aeromicrobium phragmitis]RLV55371.1 NADP-dependent oxidoreductase [Aeromicrobium phragmitis]